MCLTVLAEKEKEISIILSIYSVCVCEKDYIIFFFTIR